MPGPGRASKHPPNVPGNPLWSSDFQRFTLGALWYATAFFGVGFWIVLFIGLTRVSGYVE